MNEKTNRPEQKDNNRQHQTAVIIIAVLTAIILLILALHSCGRAEPMTDANEIKPGIIYDSSAIEGGWDEVDTEAIISSLNEKLSEGMINITMNTTPCFENGTAKGNLMIVNEGINRYPQVVEILLNETDEVIYRSGAIPVGSKIEKAALDRDLDAGTYDCTAMFHSVDSETGVTLGSAGAIISLTVLH